MSEPNSAFSEFLSEFTSPDVELTKFIGHFLVDEMQRNTKSTKDILRYASDLKRDYRELSHYAIAKNLRYGTGNTINTTERIKSVYSFIREEHGGPTLHLCSTMQNYAQEKVNSEIHANNRFGYGITIQHCVRKPLLGSTPKSWNKHFVSGRDSPADVLNTIRMMVSTLIHQIYALDKKSSMAICIREAVSKFDKYIVNTEAGLEYISYQVKTLNDSSSECEQIIVLATQGRNEVLGGYSIS